ncbi:hypothetical protein LUW76_19340 [Actinomadura madurae]|uniref:hypothetical protein n=1 Tax=Actinomadura madurae TaxID=1993 RepID=UPI00202654A7|nr:hypothetical protein [Actinomadura madurae]URM96308.1 hypothetical protein LUW76_19340 [Actinomadura madurae]
MAVADQLAIVDDLLTAPFRDQDEWTHGGFSGPGRHVVVLQASQDFWESRDSDVVEAAEAQIEAALQALVEVLTARWGTPDQVDLGPYLWSEDPAPEPMGQLSQLGHDMLVWRPPETGRWVGLSVGQADPEFPIELRAAVADASLLA